MRTMQMSLGCTFTVAIVAKHCTIVVPFIYAPRLVFYFWLSTVCLTLNMRKLLSGPVFIFLLLLLVYIPLSLYSKAWWIIQNVLNACCSHEWFMWRPLASVKLWTVSAIAEWQIKVYWAAVLRQGKPNASPWALYGRSASALLWPNAT